MVKLDLSKFKHVSSDDNSTVLKHVKDGHEIRLVHKSLSPDNQKALSALSKIPEQDRQPSFKQESKADSITKMANGGPLQTIDKLAPMAAMLAEGGNPKSEKPKEKLPGNTLDYSTFKDETNKKNREIQIQDRSKPRKMAEGGDVCEACGGPIHRDMMYEGGKPSGDSDAPSNYATPLAPATGATEDEAAQLNPQEEPPSDKELISSMSKPIQLDAGADPKTKRIRQLYTQMASMNAPSNDSWLNKLGGDTVPTTQSTKSGFTPSGGEPQYIDPQLMGKASQAYAQEQADNIAQSKQKSDAITEMNAARAQAGLEPIPDITPTGPQIPGSANNPPVQQPDQIPQAITGQVDNYDPETLMKQGLQSSISGLNKNAQAQGNLGNERAKQAEAAMNAQQSAQMEYSRSFDALNREREALVQDVKDGHVDPEQYWKGDPKTGEGSHSKILAGIGMILAGFNPTTNPNAAINFLKYQMDRNLDAQKTNLQSKNNLLAHNLQQFGNLRDATEMTRIQQNDMLAHALTMAAGKAAGPIAAAAAQNAAGQLKMQAAPQFQQFVMRRAMMNMANNPNGDPAGIEHMLGYMRAVNPEMAKEMESRYVPQIGTGSVPVPDAARQQIISNKNVNDLMNRSLDFSQKYGGKVMSQLSPTIRNEANTIHQQLIGSIKQAQHDGVYKESEADFLLKQIGDSPESMFAKFNSEPKIKQLQQIKQQEQSNLLKTYGLPDKQLPQAAQYKTVNGKKYMRGPKGEAIEVK